MDEYTTPDGAFKVQFEVVSMRMSHEVFCPRVTHLPTGRIVADFWGTLWDGAPGVDSQGRLTLDMREYPGNQPGYRLVFESDGTSFRAAD